MLCCWCACHALFVCVPQVLLGRDGADMASEVLPAQLVTRVRVAWGSYCRQQTAQLPLEQASSNSPSNGSSIKSSSKGREAATHEAAGQAVKPPGVSKTLWEGHCKVATVLQQLQAGGGSSSSSNRSDAGVSPIDTTSSGSSSGCSGGSSGGSKLVQVLLNPSGLSAHPVCLGEAGLGSCAEDRALLGAFVLTGNSTTELEQQPQQPQHVLSKNVYTAVLSATPAALQGPLQQDTSESTNSCMAEAAAEPVLLVLCSDECYSSNEPRLPLGSAVVRARIAQALWQQQQQQAEQHGEHKEQQEQGPGQNGTDSLLGLAAAVPPVYLVSLSSLLNGDRLSHS